MAELTKVVLIPDSFKGSLSSVVICQVLAEELHRQFPNCKVFSLPVADGGEGSVQAFYGALGGEIVREKVQGPYGTPVDSFYGRLPGGTAVIEMAAAAGLPLVGENRQAGQTTTYGVGMLMAKAIEAGAKEIILALGGSATNDGGCGMACALGAKFYDAQGKAFLPVGSTLCNIARLDMSGLQTAGVAVTAMCDIDNPLCGTRGAARVFAPQKGADAEMVDRLDVGLLHLATVIKRDLGVDVLPLPGGGAAGGMGAGAVAFFGATLKMGIETVLDAVGFDTACRGADLVITGEGRLDSQTLGGKVVHGVAKRLAGKKIPLIALVGAVEGDVAGIYESGVTAVFPVLRRVQSLSEAMAQGAENLRATAEDICRLWKAW